MMHNNETIIYGGSFNPPTRAHKLIVEACQAYSPMADIWLMPSGQRYDKNVAIPKHHRLGMLRAMIDSLRNPKQIAICTMEIDDPTITQTTKTVTRLGEVYSGRQFRFVYGADAYESMPQWADGERLQATLPMLLIPRLGAQAIHSTENAVVLPVDAPESSTAIRHNILTGKPIDQLVCDSVHAYISEHRLYSSQPAMA